MQFVDEWKSPRRSATPPFWPGHPADSDNMRRGLTNLLKDTRRLHKQYPQHRDLLRDFTDQMAESMRQGDTPTGLDNQTIKDGLRSGEAA